MHVLCAGDWPLKRKRPRLPCLSTQAMTRSSTKLLPLQAWKRKQLRSLCLNAWASSASLLTGAVAQLKNQHPRPVCLSSRGVAVRSFPSSCCSKSESNHRKPERLSAWASQSTLLLTSSVAQLL